MTQAYREARFTAQDGLRLYYREYGEPGSAALPVLCLAGLTRNSVDFHDLAVRLSATRRVITLDLRGRGRSDHDPNPAHYVPQTYVLDIIHLLTVARCHRVIMLGTSLGGLLAMAMAAVHPTAMAGVVINDIGPEIDPKGLERIASYAGGNPGAMTLEQATAHIRTLFGAALPDLSDDAWRREARRSFREGEDGLFRIDYDPAISRSADSQTDAPLDLWPYFRALRPVPTLAFRGALSDILSQQTFDAMAAAKPDLIRVTVANRGHVPLLDEPECPGPLDDFLEYCDRHRH